jgi:hypothetical protein
MADDDRVRSLLKGIAAVTAVSGAVQMLGVGRIVRALGSEDSPAVRQGFQTVGMFMVIVGGMQWRALSAPEPSPALVGWGAVQKLGAAAAVSLGVRRGVFPRRALFIAAQDAASGALALGWCARQRACR